MSHRRPERAAVVALLVTTACGDDMTARRLDRSADAAAPLADASPVGDVANADAAAEPTVVVFENPGGAFVFTCLRYVEDEENPGKYLDLTRSAAAQNGAGTSTSIACSSQGPSDLSTPGASWLLGWHDPDTPYAGAFLAAGEPFILAGDCGEDCDITATPPLGKQVGDVIGPGEVWRSGESVASYPYSSWGDSGGLQTGHFQDAGDGYAESQIWFTSGIVGVRFSTDDGDHYGFVEVQFVPDDYLPYSGWNAVRWGYHPLPDEPLVVPP